jgi:hypothetical protein
MPDTLQVPCQTRKMAEFCGFLIFLCVNGLFTNPKGWDFSPTFGIEDILMLPMAKFAHSL